MVTKKLSSTAFEAHAAASIDVSFNYGPGPQYWVAGTAEQLVALGVARPVENGRILPAKGLNGTISKRLDGSACVHVRNVAKLIERDTRFHEALQRVLTGGACTDFEPPKVKRARGRS